MFPPCCRGPDEIFHRRYDGGCQYVLDVFATLRKQVMRSQQVATRRGRIPFLSGNACFALRYIDPAICMDESWHWMAGVDGLFVATVLFRVALPAMCEFFISLMSVTRRVKPCSRAALLAADASGASPARMKPWPAPS